MEKRLVPLPGVSATERGNGRPQVEPAGSSDGPVQSEAGCAHKNVLKEVLQLDTSGILNNVRFKDTSAAVLPSMEECAAEFRQAVCAEIAKQWPKNKAQAQEASDLLDKGNAIFIAFERSAGSTTSTAPPPVAEEPDTFWDLPSSQWHSLLVLQAKRGPGPPSLFADLPGGLRKRRQEVSGLRGKKQHDHEWRGASRARIKVSSGNLPRNVQHQLAILLERAVEPKAASQTEAALDMSEGTPAQIIIQSFVERLHNMSDGDALLTLPLEFSDICKLLKKGELPSLASVVELVTGACQEAGVEAGFAEPGTSQQYLEQADALSGELAEALRDAAARFQKEGVVAARTVYVPPTNLPESIQANNEAYAQGDWRQQPYMPRPYVRLQTYYIEEDRRVLTWKMSTQKQTQCSGQHCLEPGRLGTFSLEKEAFQTDCGCLAKNSECGPGCGCSGRRCLNSAIQRRDTLRLGTDIDEINTWGMDCYTRKNIQDAVLESEAFGPYKRPDYKAIMQKKSASLLSQGETLQHTVKGAEAGIAQPKANSSSGNHEGDKQQPAEPNVASVGHWHETTLMPAINGQGSKAWNLKHALDEIQKQDAGTPSARAAAAIAARLAKVGENYFRVHPKGVGIVCRRQGGLPALTFVEEYLGEVHTPWRWFEIQDALKKSSKDELPDFYNIQLERPRDDPGGYDCLFIDAASKAVVMAAAGRLTIAVYTLRHIQQGEELTFDYSSVTESEKEFRAAVCLCGSTACRGSFLYFAGSKAFMQVMTTHHTMFARQILMLRAGEEPITEADQARLEKFGIKDCALGWGPGKGRVPQWLQKWVALILEYVELEQRLLPPQLLAIPPPLGNFTPETATAQAKGVSDNRLQNVVITLDKVKLCLGKPGQPQEAPLTMLSDEEITDFLWTGERSIAKRVLRAAAAGLSNAAVGRAFATANSLEELKAALEQAPASDRLQQLGQKIMQSVADATEARQALMELSEELRAQDTEGSASQSALGDLLFLYASTINWFKALRTYKGFVSPPVKLNVKDLNLDRHAAAPPLPGISKASKPNGVTRDAPTSVHIPNGNAATPSGAEPPSQLQGEAKRPRSGANSELFAGGRGKRQQQQDGDDDYDPDTGADGGEVLVEEFGDDEEDSIQMREPTAKQRRGGLCKKYGPWFIWGQLNGWYKQTVYDPTASLSAERRGTISLPDIECIFGGPRSRYTAKERDYLIEQIEKRPDGAWRSNSMWTFRNDAKVYGSPMFDAAWSKVQGTDNPMPEVLAYLRSKRGTRQ